MRNTQYADRTFPPSAAFPLDLMLCKQTCLQQWAGEGGRERGWLTKVKIKELKAEEKDFLGSASASQPPRDQQRQLNCWHWILFHMGRHLLQAFALGLPNYIASRNPVILNCPSLQAEVTLAVQQMRELGGSRGGACKVHGIIIPNGLGDWPAHLPKPHLTQSSFPAACFVLKLQSQEQF